jgi:hypothetical protein
VLAATYNTGMCTSWRFVFLLLLLQTRVGQYRRRMNSQQSELMRRPYVRVPSWESNSLIHQLFIAASQGLNRSKNNKV